MNGFQVLLTFLGAIAIISDPRSSAEDDPATENVYHGRYTRDIPSAEYLIPRRVFEDGNFYKYELPNFYDRGEVSDRRKRSTGEPDADKVHLVLPFNGIDHHVELTPYHDFISPEMVIETRGAGIRENLNEAVKFKRAPDQQCHYRGFVRDHNPSKAALSLCDGVAGYMQTNHGRYFIEPANEAQPQHDGQHVHIAYKREAPHEISASRNDTSKKFCGTDENWEAAWAEQLAKRAKRLMEADPADTKSTMFGTHSIHRYIEIGLVADRRFLDFYNNTNYEQYLLTVMNMVADFYHDKSIGNQIEVVVVRMVYLEKEKEEIDLLISPAAEDTLHSFMAWAQKINPKDHTHPNHFDVAVLVTRYDICSEGTNCNLMGLASVAAACDPERSAAINEDSGLLLGIVVAHEVGHVYLSMMGCSHDDENISGCKSKDTDDSYFIMSPIVFLYTIRWSPCSRRYVTNFLQSGLGECLNDDPRNPPERFKYPNMLPGAMYDGDHQCQMTFPGSKLCLNSQVCDKLWCQVNATCLTMGAPMADGTKCGEKKWCIRKKCVDRGTRPAAVHGGWGSWGPVSKCSRTCGGGLKSSERECDNPPPANGGRYCLGERRRVNICNTTPCPADKPSFRAVQCSEFNNVKVLSDNVLHTWTPYLDFSVKDPCILYCLNEEKILVKVRNVANDTTPCKPGTNYMCVFGVCRKVGCDWVLDSNAVDDKCGICKGDGTKCKQIKGDYTETNVRSTYTKVVTIPKGARSIRVWETKPDTNVIAVKPEKGSDYCINGNLRINRAGDYTCAKSMLVYLYPQPDKEEVEIKGPIAEDVRIEYAFFNRRSNPGIHYEYYVMSTDPSHTPKYLWDFVDWSACTVKCGGGTKISEAKCIEENGGEVSPNYCDGKPRPDPKSQICNSEPCPAKWRVSQWSKCSACDGKKGFKHRKVQCIRPASHSGKDDVQANPDACKGRVPKQKEECTGQRPCKKTCPKKARNTSKAKKSLSAAEQAKIIDKFVDLSLAHYLEQSYGAARGAGNEADTVDFRQLFRDWSLSDEDKKKRGVCDRQNTSQSRFTTPKPGSIIKDSVPIDNVVLMEAPVMEEGLQMNLSDRAFQEIGDMVGVGIDTSHIKMYNGSEAVSRLEKLEGHHTVPPVAAEKDGSLARIVER